MRIGVVGTGYVGLVTGTCLADMGHDVTCLDIQPDRVDRLNRGEVPFFELGLRDLLERNLREERLSFTTDAKAALGNLDVCFVTVGTPPQEDGSADLSQIYAVADTIASVGANIKVLVVKSTVPIGTTDGVEKHLRSKGGPMPAVVFNPEFLKEGMAVEDFMRPDRIVVGTDDESAVAMMRQVYLPFIRNGHPFLVMDRRSAEMTKYAANTMLASRISLMNEFATICENVGADIMDVRRGIGTDRRLGMSFLYAGAGYGGSCFPKDIQALAHVAKTNGVATELIPAIHSVNERQKQKAFQLIQSHFGADLSGHTFGIWGLSFKPKTDDVREAPALTTIGSLLEAGASVRAYDPEGTHNAKQLLPAHENLQFVDRPYDALSDASALVLLTEWGIFRNPDFDRVKSQLKTPVIIDGRNQYDPAEVRDLGFTYYGIGRA